MTAGLDQVTAGLLVLIGWLAVTVMLRRATRTEADPLPRSVLDNEIRGSVPVSSGPINGGPARQRAGQR